MLQTRMLVLQPTPFCNIDCDYCYLRQRHDRGVMHLDTVAAIANQIVANIEPDIETLVVWHGGEPTAVPLEWYRTAYPLLSQSKRGKPLAFTIQTNGIALDAKWARFLADTETSVGLSIDGPEDLHNRHRQTRTGRATWHLTMRAIDTLRAHGVEPGVITVLTAESLTRADDMLAFYIRHGIQKLSFSVEEKEGANAGSSLDFPAVDAAMEAFLLEFMRGLAAAGAEIHVREPERILGLLASGQSNVGQNEQTEPLACITVDWTGGVYTYSPEFTEHASGDLQHARIGHLGRQTMDEIIAGPELRRLSAEVAVGLAACQQTCQFWDVCGGGSPVNRMAEHGSLAVAETQFCRLTVQATARALRRLLAETQPSVPRRPVIALGV
jgi:uncharacterized protein